MGWDLLQAFGRPSSRRRLSFRRAGGFIAAPFLVALTSALLGQVAVPVQTNVKIENVEAACGAVWLRANNDIYIGGPTTTFLYRDAHLERVPVPVREITEGGGRCWISTVDVVVTRTSSSAEAGPLYEYRDGRIVPTGIPARQIGHVGEEGGVVWGLPNYGDPGNLYRLEAGRFVQIGRGLGPVIVGVDVVGSGQFVLTGTDDDDRGSTAGPAYRIVGATLVRVGPPGMGVRRVLPDGPGFMLIGNVGEVGLVVRQDGTSLRLPGQARMAWPVDGGAVIRVTSGADRATLTSGTDRSKQILLLRGGALTQLPLPGDTELIRLAGLAVTRPDRRFPGTIVIFAPAGPITFNPPGGVRGVVEAGGRIWVTSGREFGQVYRYGNGQFEAVANAPRDTKSIIGAAGRVWLTNQDGELFRLDGPQFVQIAGTRGVERLEAARGRLWLLAEDHPTFWMGLTASRAERVPFHNAQVERVVEAGENSWILDPSQSVYRIDDNVTMRVRLVSPSSAWGNFIRSTFGANWWISGRVGVEARYARVADGSDPYGPDVSRAFTVAFAGSEEELEDKIARGSFSPIEDASTELSPGIQSVHLAVRDSYGNIVRVTRTGLWVAPALVAVPVLIGILWLLLLIGLILLAPKSDYLNRVLMNRVLRRYGSFGLVPLLFALVPWFRKHVLRRYVTTVRHDPEFEGWDKRFVPPDAQYEISKLGELLDAERAYVLLGRSGIGKTSFLKYVMASLTSGVRFKARKAEPIPVYISLARYSGTASRPEEMFALQLRRFGDVTDTELAEQFLEAGGFLILLDGLNEVGNAMRASVAAFVEANARRNCVIVSSQHHYEEISELKALDVPLMSDAAMHALFEICVSTERAGDLAAQASRLESDIYRVPQNIVLASRLVNSGAPLPSSENDLFEAVISPVFASWIADGQPEYGVLLTRRAFQMVVESDLYLATEEAPLPPALAARLREEGLIRKSDSAAIFVHDSIRDYLAGNYLTRHWEQTFHDHADTLSRSWLPALHSAARSIMDENELGEFLLALLDKSPALAAAVYKQWKANVAAPQPWEAKFASTYGIRLLKAA